MTNWMTITILVCLQEIVPNETSLCHNSETGSFVIYLGDACFVNIDRTQNLSITTETQKMSGHSYCTEHGVLEGIWLSFIFFFRCENKLTLFV